MEQTNIPTELNTNQANATSTNSAAPANNPAPAVQPTTTPNNSGKKKQLVLMAGVIFLLIILITLFIYAKGSLNRVTELTVKPTIKVQAPTAIIEKPEKAEEEIEAEAVDTGDPTSDINELEEEASML